MKDSKLEFTSVNEVETVYYEAFRYGDMDVMRALWADGDVVCVHPGSSAIIGYDAVIRSWSYILEQAHPPQFEYDVIRQEESEDMAFHLVAEKIALQNGNSVLVLATNIYKLFGQGWLMIEHHASLVQSDSSGQTLQ